MTTPVTTSAALIPVVNFFSPKCCQQPSVGSTCQGGHKSEWPSWSGLGTQQGPAAWAHTQGGASSHPGTHWVPRALHAPESSAWYRARAPACLSGLRLRTQHSSPGPSHHHPSSLGPLCVVRGGEGRGPHSGVQRLPGRPSSWALAGQGGRWPVRAAGRRRDLRASPCLRGTTDPARTGTLLHMCEKLCHAHLA